MKCDCISYNNPEKSGGTDLEVVMIPPFQDKSVCIDSCIADEIQLMWIAGYRTWGCCCGHNELHASVIVDKKQVESLEWFVKTNFKRKWFVFSAGDTKNIKRNWKIK